MIEERTEIFNSKEERMYGWILEGWRYDGTGKKRT